MSKEFIKFPPLKAGKENPKSDLMLASPALTSVEKRRGNGVFRYGETLESLFGLNDNSDDEYRRICEQIAFGEPSPTLWRQVLQQSQLRGSNLMRLHRRATNRFPMSDQDQSLDLLCIWISYARLVSNQIEILDYVHSFAWSRKHAVYYICRAELDEANAVHHLSVGLSENAEPKDLIQKALQEIESAMTQRRGKIYQQDQAPPPHHERYNANAPSAKSQDTEGKRIRKPLQTLKIARESDHHDLIGAVAVSRAAPGSQDSLPPLSKFKFSGSKGLDLESKARVNSSDQPVKQLTDFSSDSSQAMLLTTGAGMKRGSRPPISSRIKPLRGRLGKAKRVDHESQHESIERNETQDTLPSSAKLTKKDLAYMFSWDPTQRNNTSTANSHEDSSINSTTTTSNESSQDEVKLVSKQPATPNEPVQAEDNNGDTNQSSKTSPLNSKFAPFIREENMIYVNKVPYMKLGAIGKGGSSKVYRVMSMKGKMWAIKKVDLTSDGLREETAIGYTNEIALLRRLKGNPCIVDLHDSEVVPKKAIYMVMEEGGADLNCVLQRINKSDGHLNINFIRLTWYQMLMAVHSIHEARIIHGDLKPANFLFVQGSLKLIDFGIAKAIQSDDTTNIYRDSQTGTVNYMSPESLKASGSKLKCGRVSTSCSAFSHEANRPVVVKPSDVWSLGCILYQMLYGRTPFAGIENLFAKLQAIVDPKHNIIFQKADSKAIEIVRACLQRNPEDRAPISGPGGLLEHSFLHSAS